MSQRKLAALVLAAAALAGCAAPTHPWAPQHQGIRAQAGEVNAKASPQEASAVIAAATNPTFDRTMLGIPAVLRAPTDVVAQRGLESLYGQAIEKALPTIDRSVDEAFWPGRMAEYLKQQPPVTDPEVQAYVDGIAARLAKAAGSKPFKVFIADTPRVDAFNSGGHAMMLFSGLIRDARDEAELAGVMAHEMVHGLRRHSVQGRVVALSQTAAARRVAQIHPLAEEETTLVDSYVASLPARMQQDPDAVLGHLAGKVGEDTMTNVRFWQNDLLATITVGRGMEAEADRLGVKIVAAAGYDPQGMVRVFERWNRRAPGDDRFYDHPPLGSRAGALKGQIAAEGLKGEDTGADRHAKIVERLKPASPVAASEVYAPPADAAGTGCIHGRPWKALR
jgi:Zn-dependent protease with chaperone function